MTRTEAATRRTARKLLLLATFVTCAGEARAQDPPLTEAAVAIMKEAARASDEKQWAVCRTKAAGVWDQTKSFRVAGLLGRCEAELGMYRDAAEHLDFYLKHDDRKIPERTAQVQASFDKARANVGLLDIQCLDAGAPAACDVVVDGKSLGKTPLKVFVGAGSQVIEGSKESRPAPPQRVDVAMGGTANVSLQLGDAAGGGGSGGSDEVTEKPIWPAALLGGLGGAAVLTGIGLTIGSRVEYGSGDDLHASCEGDPTACRNDVQDKLDQSALLQNVGFAMFGVGAAAFAGLGIYLAVPASPSSAARVRITPQSGPGYAGVVLQGQY
jgi:hypothetical protein